ncbi:uncharacterized protein EI97DRAFT_250235 [Westerdykella ornata]|uniref:Uncharacterized protein n=1 Tax=Westerdykella ornata TaxID=318751 RepID=A0A6A6JTH1_WESOR|nr:uncharacterized protein EI97DRAFT_250235 [Westerdykella ornata]KAF2278299.1 hypothetical protein EI97DRAFT_250235 [Westerdykella ornata]
MEEDVAQRRRSRSCSPNVRPPHRSSVYIDPFAQRAQPRFQKGDSVHMSIIENGIRRKGTFKIHKGRYNGTGGFWEYQMLEDGSRLYNNGAWVREKDLKLEKRRE